jgi:hypothetical protein
MQIFTPHNPALKVDHFDFEDAVEVSVPIEDKTQLDFEPTVTGDVQLGDWDSDWTLPWRRLVDIHGFIACTVIPAFMKFNLAAIPTERIRVGERRAVYLPR